MSTILVLANFSSGLYDFRNELLAELLKGNKVVVSIPDEVKRKELEEEGCEVVHTSINRRGINPFEDLSILIEYKRLLKKIQPDIVLTYTIKPNVYGGFLCRWKKIPYITTITGLGSAFQKQGILRWLIVRMYRMALKEAECIFFQNTQNKKIFEQCRIRGKESVLVNGSGVNLNRHSFEEYPGLNVRTLRLLFIGRIMKEKGIEEFLKAAEKLHNKDTVFEVLGGCDENYQAMLADYEKRDIVKNFGFQTNVHEYIKAASVIVLPTYHEGMSNVLMEASATGRPVIASNISGCKEVFEEGVTGFGCEPRNADSLIAAIEKFLALDVEERAEMGRQARRKMEQEFDRKQVTDVYIKEINKVLITKNK